MRPGGSVGGEGRLKGLQNLLSLSLSTCTRLLNLPDCSPSAFIPSAFIPSSPLVQFNMEGLRSALLPWACRGYSALMSRLAASATARLKALLAELAAHTALLRDRPSELPQFAAYMEAAWGHLLEDGAKRRAVIFAQVGGGCHVCPGQGRGHSLRPRLYPHHWSEFPIKKSCFASAILKTCLTHTLLPSPCPYHSTLFHTNPH